ncbi:MAG: hypothetical protein ACLQAH_11965 [Limisphaerales bacterium]
MANFIKQKPSLLAGQAILTKAQIDPTATLAFSLRHFDSRQGQRFEEWEERKLLSQMLEVFRGYCLRTPVAQCFNPHFKPYKEFPAKSDFRHPAHVPPDATWYSMHLAGLPCVVGHMINHVFYVVFLDMNHRFFPVDLQDRGK